MPNPNAEAVGQPANTNNPGVSVSLFGETNMKLAALWFQYQENTSWIVAPADITLANTRLIEGLQE